MTGEKIPDSTIGYSYEEIYTTIDAYGTEGIRFYRYIEATDLLFPLIYGALLALLMGRAFAALDVGDRTQLLLFVVPLTVACDFLENGGIFLMLWRHPDSYVLLARTTNVLTLLKFAGILFSVLVIVLAGGVVASRKVLRRERTQK